jgi:hypothetical protein
MLPDSSKLPVIVEEPVRINVSIAENVELPDTTKEPLIIAPFDDVTDDRWASLPLTITLFQVGNYHSILLFRVRSSIHININLQTFRPLNKSL